MRSRTRHRQEAHRRQRLHGHLARQQQVVHAPLEIVAGGAQVTQLLRLQHVVRGLHLPGQGRDQLLVQLLQLGAAGRDIDLQRTEIVEIGIVQLVQLDDIGQHLGLVLLQLGRDAVDLRAHVLILVEVLLDLALDAEQPAEEAGPVGGVDVADVDLAQLRHHRVQRVAGLAHILGADVLQHGVGDRGELLLRLAAEEDDRVAVVDVELLQRLLHLLLDRPLQLDLQVARQLLLEHGELAGERLVGERRHGDGTAGGGFLGQGGCSLALISAAVALSARLRGAAGSPAPRSAPPDRACRPA